MSLWCLVSLTRLLNLLRLGQLCSIDSLFSSHLCMIDSPLLWFISSMNSPSCSFVHRSLTVDRLEKYWSVSFKLLFAIALSIVVTVACCYYRLWVAAALFLTIPDCILICCWFLDVSFDIRDRLAFAVWGLFCLLSLRDVATVIESNF